MHKKDIFINLIGNDIITGDINNIESLNHSIGYGLGITLISPLGPMDFSFVCLVVTTELGIAAEPP